MTKIVKEEYLLETKKQVRRKYLGVVRGTTKTGKPANGIVLEPDLKTKKNR